MKRIALIGVTSSIGEEIARECSVPNVRFYLTGRDSKRLAQIGADLEIRGAQSTITEHVDLTDCSCTYGLSARAAKALGGLDIVIFVAGQLPDQDELNWDSQRLRETMEINTTTAMVLLNETAAFFEQQGHGQIVAIGSVAGDRGRATNYAYGAAKGALEIFLSGLRQRLSRRGVKVLLVKPGFVDTPMTAAFKKGPLWASPERVAKDIVRAMETGKSVIYTPWWWRWIMLVIRLIPEPIFVRLRF